MPARIARGGGGGRKEAGRLQGKEEIEDCWEVIDPDYPPLFENPENTSVDNLPQGSAR